jgi:hypothetical protein
VLAQRKAHLASRGQQFSQFGRRDESNAEQRHAPIKQQPFDCVSLTTKGHCHQSGLLLLPGEAPCCFKPWKQNGLPRRVKRRADVQRDVR